MRLSNFLPFLLCLFASPLFSQSNIQQSLSVNPSGSPADASAQLDVSASGKGVLIPRMTSAERTGIVAPATSLLVYDTDTDGFWFYNGTAWTRMTDASQGNGGKTYFVLSGNVSNAEAAQRIQNDIGVNTQFVWIQNTTQLTTVSFPNLSQLVEIIIQYNASLSTVDFPGMTDVWRDVQVIGNPNLTALGLPALMTSDFYFEVYNNSALPTLSLPALTTSTGQFIVTDNSALTTLSFPALTSTGHFNVYNNSALTTLSLPALT